MARISDEQIDAIYKDATMFADERGASVYEQSCTLGELLALIERLRIAERALLHACSKLTNDIDYACQLVDENTAHAKRELMAEGEVRRG